MNILLINHYAGAPALGMEFRPYYMARHWIAAGHRVLIVGGTYSHVRKEQPDEGRLTIDGVDYLWLKTPHYGNNGIQRAFSMFSFVRQLYGLNETEIGFRPDVVIASSTYPLDNYPARYLSGKFKAKFVYEVHDLWPLSPIELGGMSPRHPFIVMMQCAENYAYRHVDKVVSLLPNAEEHMRAHGLAAGKFVYVPNGFEPSEWHSDTQLDAQHSAALSALKKEGKFLLGYVGGHAISNALDVLLDVIKMLNNPNLSCVLVGKGIEKERLKQRVADEQIAGVLFLPPVDKTQVPALLSMMDALYSGRDNRPLYRFGISPNKLIDYMMAARPIVHASCSPNDMVDEAACGFSATADNREEIAEAIAKLTALSDDERKAMGQRGHDFVATQYAYASLANKMIDAMK